MGATVLDMSISLDGFVAGPNEGPGNGLGDGGDRLHEWFFAEPLEGADASAVEETMTTGAVVAGRTTFELAGGWSGDHHDGVSIFILSNEEPGIDVSGWPLVTYLDDVRAAMARAREAAGERDVLVHGVGTTRLALAAGVLDEIQLHVVPILLGGGRRLFDGDDPRELEPARVAEGRGAVHLRYRVQP